ncbi:hypothetical protein [Arthrobacter sp. 4R501]|uniref:hypothetical protein n=1 Tax=Arthrobacter sp. 4R501 TaxID=2058886 RepID=UPI000CE3DE6A|nr:hypothetical protein [Arthrobacter sp. 4R501]
MADGIHDDGREIWDVAAPPGGWGQPWPQCVELARNLAAQHWTLVGGLMVQLHAARAGLAVARPTADVDIVLHLETPGTTVAQVHAILAGMGYTLQTSIDSAAPAHRFVRGKEQVDVMVADRVAPHVPQRLGGHDMFALPAGTQALKRTVYCRFSVPAVDDDGDGDDEKDVLISIPNVLGALVLKGAAYREDSRDTRRHLDDAVVLSACVLEPLTTRDQMKGSDRSRIIGLHDGLGNRAHQSWMLLEDEERQRARMNLKILADNPQNAPRFRRLGQS